MKDIFIIINLGYYLNDILTFLSIDTILPAATWPLGSGSAQLLTEMTTRNISEYLLGGR